MGLRELKKQKTRKAISDLATQLFIDRGYYNVTTAEIAELAEVSIPTLFKYFPTKEMLVFDEDLEIERWLVTTIKNKKKEQKIIEALFLAGIKRIDEVPNSHKDSAKKFMNLIHETPELNHYANQMWLRHEAALALIISKETKKRFSTIETESIARFILNSFYHSMKTPNTKEALKKMFSLIQNGWNY
jgi:AcrR family transcriptional regulator